MNRRLKVGLLVLIGLAIAAVGVSVDRRSRETLSKTSAELTALQAGLGESKSTALGSARPVAPSPEIDAAGAARLQSNTSYLNRIFEPVLPAFRLDHSQQQAVRAVILEWLETLADAAEIVSSMPIMDVKVRDAIRLNTEEVERQFGTIVSQEVADKLTRMLQAIGAIEQVANDWAPRLQKLGYSLTSEQRLVLGLALHEAYDRRETPNLPLREHAPVDQDTGLSTLDTIVLQRVSTALTPPQVKAIRAHLIETNRLLESYRRTH